MEDGVLIDDGRFPQFRDVGLVLHVGVGERKAAGAMRLDQHALELDLGEAPLAAPLAQAVPDVADVGLAVAGPALRPRLCVLAHLVGEAHEVWPRWLRRRWQRCYDPWPQQRRPCPARPDRRFVRSVEVAPEQGQPKRGAISLSCTHMLRCEGGDEAGVGAEVARLL